MKIPSRCGTMAVGRITVGAVLARLDPDTQAKFDCLRAAIGEHRLAEALGCTRSTLDRLDNGGTATAKAIERLTPKINQLHGEMKS